MKKTKTICYRLIENWRNTDIVPPAIAQQLDDLLNDAYAPYSSYPVSSIVVLDNGEQFLGTNQENAAFPSGLCAERVSVLAAKAARPHVPIKAVYIMTGETERAPAAPCGACRQVLHEAELRQPHPYDLFILNRTPDLMAFHGVQDLLPFSFTLPA